MQLLLSRWAAAFAAKQPGVALEIDGRGSGAALHLFGDGRIDFAALSREPSDSEQAAAGVSGRLRTVRVGWDTLSLLARGRAEGGGFHGPFSGDARDVRPFGRNLSSGTRAEARSALGRGFGPSVRSLPSPGGVEDAVAADPKAVGYGGGGGRLSRSRAVAALRIRPLVLAFPGGGWTPAGREFASFVLSREGQELVERSGFRPLHPDTVAAVRRRLGLDG